jgi:TetR/AcrR family transcriptional repressor of nem operon
MRVSREVAAANRARIIAMASNLFREKGFNGIGVADIMQAADLTHGGFYGHFKSKDELVVEACETALAKAALTWAQRAADAPERPLEALYKEYLSPGKREQAGRSCCFAVLGADAARQGKPVRAAFAAGLKPLIDILAKFVPAASKAARRRKALAVMSQLVGAMVLARAVDDPALSDEILAAAKAELLRGQ